MDMPYSNVPLLTRLRTGIVMRVVIRILCEVEAVGDSLTGRITRRGGEIREFTGWLGLLGALQAMVADAAPAPPDRNEEPPK